MGGALAPAPAPGARAFPGDEGDVVDDRLAAEGVVGLQRAIAQRGADLMGGHARLARGI